MTALSVIIPCYNEHEILSARLEHIMSLCDDKSKVEFIICDAFYGAPEYMAAKRLGALYCTTDMARRSLQMHRGASNANGNCFFFLHIDSTPPRGFDTFILQAVRDGAGSGCFRLTFDSSSMFLSFFAWFTRFGWGIARGGDQGLFVKSELYRRIYGFKTHMRVMEDVEIIRRLRKYAPFRVLPATIITSARKYRQEGMVRLQCIFACIHLLYWCGASEETLFKTYRKFIGRSSL